MNYCCGAVQCSRVLCSAGRCSSETSLLSPARRLESFLYRATLHCTAHYTALQWIVHSAQCATARYSVQSSCTAAQHSVVRRPPSWRHVAPRSADIVRKLASRKLWERDSDWSIQWRTMPLKVTLVSPRSKSSLGKSGKSSVSVTSEFEFMNLPQLRSPRKVQQMETSTSSNRWGPARSFEYGDIICRFKW